MTCYESSAMVKNGTVEDIHEGVARAWIPYESGYVVDHVDGIPAILCELGHESGNTGAYQRVELEEPLEHLLVVSGLSKAENVALGGHYSIWADLEYVDGSHSWAHQAHFYEGTHDWERAETLIYPEKCIKGIDLYVMFRNTSGKAWFKDIAISLLDLDIQEVRAVIFEGSSTEFEVEATFNMRCKWEVESKSKDEFFSEFGQGRTMRIRRQFEFGTEVLQEMTIRGICLNGHTQILRSVDLASIPVVHDGYAAWYVPSDTRIWPRSLPTLEDSQKPVIKLRGARNEHLAFQLGIRTSSEFQTSNCSVSIGSFTSTVSGSMETDIESTWYLVGYVPISRPVSHPCSPDLGGEWWPDPLLPVNEFEIPKSQTRGVWIDVFVGEEVAHGRYCAELRVDLGNDRTWERKIELEVVDITLPRCPSIKTAFAFHEGFMKKLYGDYAVELRRKYVDFVLNHRLNFDDFSRPFPPDVQEIAGVADRINAFCLLNLVPEPALGEWVNIVAPADVYTSEFMEHMMQRLEPVVEQAKEFGLLEKTYIYGFDEREEEYFAVMKDLLGRIKERWPELAVMTTARIDKARYNEFDIDWICPLTSDYDCRSINVFRESGGEGWWYVCCGPSYPEANCLMSNPLIESRLLFWITYRYGVDGFLYWGLNVWNRDERSMPLKINSPFMDFGVTWIAPFGTFHGDGILIYPGEGGPISSIRLENILLGIEDYEYFCMLARERDGAEHADALVRKVVRSRSNFSRDLTLLEGVRDELINLILKRQKASKSVKDDRRRTDD